MFDSRIRAILKLFKICVLLLSAAVVPVSADWFISGETLNELVDIVRNGGCKTKCELSGGAHALLIAGPIEGRRAYEVSKVDACGSAGCGITAIMIWGEDAWLIGNAFGLDARSRAGELIEDPNAIAALPKVFCPERTAVLGSTNWWREVVLNGELGKFGHGTYPSLGNRTHVGQDITAPCNGELESSVFVVQSGEVLDVVKEPADKNFNSLGYMAIVKHSNFEGGPAITIYLHLKMPPRVGIGDRVSSGSLIGFVGTTGASYGCHLHFEVRRFDGRFQSEWRNIYGKGDQRNSRIFTQSYIDPGSWVTAVLNKSSEIDQ